MTNLARLKLGLTLIGVVTWGYGVRAGQRPVQWLGIAFLLVAFILRFAPRERK